MIILGVGGFGREVYEYALDVGASVKGAGQFEQAGLRIEGDTIDPQWVRMVWRKELDVRGGPLPRILWHRAKDEVHRLTPGS